MMKEELPGMLALAEGVKSGVWPHTMDAQVWARKWLEITKDKPVITRDEGFMIGWFANAIMAGYDTAMYRSCCGGCWSKERPTEPGRYWVKQYQHKRVVHLLRLGTNQMLYASENGVSRPLDAPMYEDALWWSELIVEPE